MPRSSRATRIVVSALTVFWSLVLAFNLYNRPELSKKHAALAVYFLVPIVIILIAQYVLRRRPAHAATAASVLWAVTGGLYAAEAYLSAQCGHCGGAPLAPTERLQFLRSLRAQGIEAYPTYSAFFSEGALPVWLGGGQKIHPLGGIARVRTVIGKESFGMTQYDSDEHGFRNPLGTWSQPADIVLVGDSFTEGCCVDDGGTIADGLRRHFPRVANLGRMGYGPLHELAVLREYAPDLKPKVLVWVFADVNDITDLDAEVNDRPMFAYLERGYRQGLVNYQPDIDKAVRAFIDRKEDVYAAPSAKLSRIVPRELVSLRNIAEIAVLKVRKAKETPSQAAAAPEAKPASQGAGAGTGRPTGEQAVAAATATPANDAPAADPMLVKYAKIMTLFDRIMREAKATADDLGARIYFVRLRTDWSDPRMEAANREAMRLAAANGLTVIDVTDELRRQERPETFAPAKEHYSALGYGLVADLVRQQIARDGGLRP